MSKSQIKAGTAVKCFIRHTESIVDALVIATSTNAAFFGIDGEPAVELVTVDPEMLRHAGTPDFHLTLKRYVDVPHTSSQQWLIEDAPVGYVEIFHEGFIKPELPPSYTAAPGDFAQAGDPYGIGKEYAEQSFHTPEPVAPTSEPVAPKPEPPAALSYAIVIDGKKIAEGLTVEQNVKRADGSLVEVHAVREGDALEGDAIVKSITQDGNNITIASETKPAA